MLWLLALLLAPAAPDYAIVVSRATDADPAWHQVVAALGVERAARIYTYDQELGDLRRSLAERLPRYTCFVARPEEAGRSYVAAVHRLVASLNDDPYPDTQWGIVTGYTPAAALRLAQTREPLTITRGAAGTPLNLDAFAEGCWYDEGKAGHSVRKSNGRVTATADGPADSTAALVGLFNDYQTQFWMTSGHATERDWQPGYNYPNGQFRCRDGVVIGLDRQRREYPVNSPNPKVYLAAGNCLIGHVDSREAMALAFLNSAGVRQMVGYTVVTWFGRGGWGVGDWWFGQAGRHSFSECYMANQVALLDDLRRLDPTAPTRPIRDWPQDINAFAQQMAVRGEKPREQVGLLWDRDTVAFYGDPAWSARLAPRELPWEQTVRPDGDDLVLTVTTRAATKARVFAPLPRTLREPQVVAGAELHPVLGAWFVYLPELQMAAGQTVTVQVRG
ncbi:MAG: hypothetical protein IT204_11425 [Fimbriimonadaceae bacterium]|nr:hypothetical protein [Fimbriimonadaceae bacterium]